MNFHGRSRISARHPEAQAICDRCGTCYSRYDLNYQYEYAGASLINTHMLVCDRCRDIPHEWTRGQALPLGPDPLPVRDPRPDVSSALLAYVTDEFGRVVTDENGVPLVVGETSTQIPSVISADDDTTIVTDDGSAIGTTSYFT